MDLKLGKQKYKFDPRTFKMRDYLKPGWVPPPFSDHSLGKKQWGMMLNDTLGDCTIAAVGHAMQVFTLGKLTVPDSVILSYYEKWCGYNPADPSTDQGGIELDVLNDWRKQSFAGHILEGYVDPQPQNFLHIQHAISEFGGVYIGFQVPQSAMDQFNAGQIWDVVPNDGGIVGGHAVFCPAYHTLDPHVNKRTTINCITWGGVQKMTIDFWDKYCDESHCLLAAAWEPAGVNLNQLRADLASIGG